MIKLNQRFYPRVYHFCEPLIKRCDRFYDAGKGNDSRGAIGRTANAVESYNVLSEPERRSNRNPLVFEPDNDQDHRAAAERLASRIEAGKIGACDHPRISVNPMTNAASRASHCYPTIIVRAGSKLSQVSAKDCCTKERNQVN